MPNNTDDFNVCKYVCIITYMCCVEILPKIMLILGGQPGGVGGWGGGGDGRYKVGK